MYNGYLSKSQHCEIMYYSVHKLFLFCLIREIRKYEIILLVKEKSQELAGKTKRKRHY